jgi:hypothetical protein
MNNIAMLKITKGLRPFVESGITTYTDSKGNKYVRVREKGEDFCIAAQDYICPQDWKKIFTWKRAMKLMEEEGDVYTYQRTDGDIY